MQTLVRNYKAEIYQMLHSKLLIVHLVVPMVGILLFVSYYRYAPWENTDKISAYLQAVAMAFPILAAIVIGMDCEGERNAANFQRILTMSHSKKLGHLSKLLALGTLGVMSVLITVVGFGILTIAMGNDVIGLVDYFKLAMLLFVTNIGWYSIEYIVSFNWGSGIALGLGIVGGLLSPLMVFDLGDGIWQMIPCAWGMRLVGYTFEMMNASENQHIQGIFQQGFDRMIVISLLILFIFIIWSERWQGLGRQEE